MRSQPPQLSASRLSRCASEAAQGGRGPKGKGGDNGVTPAISIGTVTNVGPAGPPTVTISGPPEAPVLNFELQQGSGGAPGAAGPSGAEALAAQKTAEPTPQNATFRFPSGTGVFGPGHSWFFLTAIVEKLDGLGTTTGESRAGIWIVHVNGRLGLQIGNVHFGQLIGWFASAAPLPSWGGLASINITLVSTTNSEFSITIACAGPATGPSPPACKWSVNLIPIGNNFVGP